MNKIIKFLAVAFLLAGTMFFASSSDKKELAAFELDAVSAATDGTECLDPNWNNCAPGWKDKGYAYDNAKGYFVKGAATTTKATTAATTAATTTTKAAETTKATTTKAGETTKATTTKAGETTAATTATSETTTAVSETTTAAEVTTAAPETTPAPTTTVAPAAEGELPVGMIVGGLALVAVVGFFIFKGISDKQ